MEVKKIKDNNVICISVTNERDFKCIVQDMWTIEY